MKTEFAFVALPISALVVPSTFAVQYLTADQAQRAIFPGKSFAAAPVTLTSGQRKAIEKASGVRVLRGEQQVWRVSGGGWFIVDEVVGKHEYITYAAGLNADGSVKQIEIMDYRETYGDQIRDQKWRAQFVGKTSKSTLKLDSDIKNISGATLSCRHVTDGVKRLLAFYEIALKH
ncbi:MAG TPA: FMN-binding protein [Candidatus Udaeobacter sp.]|jgi:Na+-translocating ferredoxin:NAD+ oxidoreductase RnfG subunit|nr:FMN-binding protein [Candidatus Udaeobacter sp.]